MRSETPEPPFWASLTVTPYSFPRSQPLALDYVRLLGTGIEKADVTICRSPAEQLDGDGASNGPVLIDSSESAETIYRRGEQCHRRLVEGGEAEIIHLISALGAVPELAPSPKSLIVVSAWPVHFADLERLADELAQAQWRWALAIPILFPATTDLETLERLANLAASRGAESLTGVRFDLDPNARHALAATFPTDDETYSTLFDEGEAAISLATERHIAALAAEHSIGDAIAPPRLSARSNWNAAIAITLAGYRLIQTREDVELGWEFVRWARQIATLPKPLTRVAAAATLSIIDGLPPQLSDALEEWISRGSAILFDEIDSRWRLRRDYRP